MENVRDNVWEAVHARQEENRESLLNRNRQLENVESINRATKDDVLKLANDVKKKNLDSNLLKELKEVLMQQKENIDYFLSVDGALEALVKALSGQSSTLQINAAYCLCNLALGEKHMKIIKIAGPYLLLHLEGMNTYLMEVCLWTLGNLSRHDEKGVKLLKTQGALPHFLRLLHHNDENVINAALYALSYFLHTGYDFLTENDFQIVLDNIIPLYTAKQSSIAYLISLLSSNKYCMMKLLQDNVHIKSLDFLKVALNENVLSSVWYVRIIGNLVAEETGQAGLQILTHEESNAISDVVERIGRSGQVFLVKECCWVLGNLMNHPNEQISLMLSASKVIDKIENPVRNYLLHSTGVS